MTFKEMAIKKALQETIPPISNMEVFVERLSKISFKYLGEIVGRELLRSSFGKSVFIYKGERKEKDGGVVKQRDVSNAEN